MIGDDINGDYIKKQLISGYSHPWTFVIVSVFILHLDETKVRRDRFAWAYYAVSAAF